MAEETYRVALIGPANSGKSTQGRLAQERLGHPIIDVGEHLRQVSRDGTERGNKLRDIMDRGDLVSDELVIPLVFEQIDKPEIRDKFILVGFPRTLDQASALVKGLKVRKRELDVVVHLEVEVDELKERASRRRICECCNKIYQIDKPDDTNPLPCATCGNPLTCRQDDKPEAVENRLRIYQSSSQKLLAYLRGHGLLENITSRRGMNADDVYAEWTARLQARKQSG